MHEEDMIEKLVSLLLEKGYPRDCIVRGMTLLGRGGEEYSGCCGVG